jgi:hypothetical protein
LVVHSVVGPFVRASGLSRRSKCVMLVVSVVDIRLAVSGFGECQHEVQSTARRF